MPLQRLHPLNAHTTARILLLLVAWTTVWTTVLAGSSRPAAAQSVVGREFEIKATYLFHFLRYVTWPEGRLEALGNEYVIGILGRDPFGRQLQVIEQTRRVGGRRIRVRRFDSIDQYQPCHILFVSRFPPPGRPRESVEDRLQAALEQTRNTPVLVVSDSPGLARRGAMINFVVDVRANRIRMEINLQAVQQAGMRIAAPLLDLDVVTLL